MYPVLRTVMLTILVDSHLCLSIDNIRVYRVLSSRHLFEQLHGGSCFLLNLSYLMPSSVFQTHFFIIGFVIQRSGIVFKCFFVFVMFMINGARYTCGLGIFSVYFQHFFHIGNGRCIMIKIVVRNTTVKIQIQLFAVKQFCLIKPLNTSFVLMAGYQIISIAIAATSVLGMLLYQ